MWAFFFILEFFYYSRLCLCSHGLVKAERIERVGQVLVHKLVEINAASGTFTLIVALCAAGIASSCRVARIAIRGNAGSGADRGFDLRRRDGIGALCVVVAGVLSLAGDGHGQGTRVVLCGGVRRHGDSGNGGGSGSGGSVMVVAVWRVGDNDWLQTEGGMKMAVVQDGALECAREQRLG